MQDEVHEAMLYEKLDGKKVRCKLCNHYCLIPDNALGFCAVRKNEGGKLVSLSYGKSTGFAVDPIEKKPFFHFKPSSRSLSFGTPGCNFRCLNCQNYFMSQAPREVERALDFPATQPREVAEMAVRERADGISYTYSEPTIFFEYARDTIKETRKLDASKYHSFVSNGFFSKECFELIKKEKLLEAIRIDLKSVDDGFYKKYCGAPSVKPVLENIKRVFESGIHLEVIALVIPTLNDGDEELRELSRFIASVSKDVPLHFLRFFPYYRMGELPPTPEKTLLRAREIARGEGLHFVYVGNADVAGGEDTVCPKCGELLVSRDGFSVVENKLSEPSAARGRGKCLKCGQRIYGVW